MKLVKKAILLSYISAASASAAIITPALPVIASAFHLGQGSLEWIVSIFLLGYMLGQLFYGPFANRFGRLRALRFGFIVNLIGILICLLSILLDSYLLLLAGRLITALGAAAGLCCTFTLINELMDEHEAKQALSYAVLSFTLGIGLAIYIGGLLTQYISWAAVFYVLALHGILILLSTWCFQETLKQKQSIHIVAIYKGYLTAFSSKRLIIYSLLLGFVSVNSYCYSTAAPMIAHAYLNLTPAQYGSWNSLTMVGMLLGSLSAAQLLKRFAMSRILWLSIGFIVLTFISFIFEYYLQWHNSLWFFTTASLLYLFAGWLYPCAAFFASNAIADKAHASGSMNFINMASAAVSVTIMGYLPFASFAAFISVICLFLLICIMLYLAYHKQINLIKR